MSLLSLLLITPAFAESEIVTPPSSASIQPLANRAAAKDNFRESTCSFCAKPRGPVGATTIDIGSGFPLWFSARSITALYSHSPSLNGFGLSGGIGIRAGLDEVLVDLTLISHFYTNRHFSIAAQAIGNLGASLDQRPLLIQRPAFEGGFTVGLIATGKVEPHIYFSLYAALEYKGIRDVVVSYLQQQGPGFDPGQISGATRSPSTVGLLLEPAVEVRLHKHLNLFVRGGYTFRWSTQEIEYAKPYNLLSGWHIALGFTVKLGSAR